MAKSNAYHTNVLYLGLGTGIILCRKLWFKPVVKASYVYDSLQRWVNKTKIIGLNVKIGVQQSTLCYILDYYKN